MLWMLPLVGAAAGALLKRKDPLQGALMGGALGATGGLLAPAAGAAAAGGGLAAGGAAAEGAAAAGGAGLTMPSIAPAAGLAQGPGFTAGIGEGLKLGAGASLGAPPAAGMAQAGEYARTGLMGLQAASLAKGLTASQPMQAAGNPQRQGPDMSALMQANQQTAQAGTQQEMLRRQMQQQVIQGLLGARNGFA